jgi:hypothetical protein
MPRARVAIAAAIATTCAVGAAACSLSDVYSSEYGENPDAMTAPPGLDASTDATQTSDTGTVDTSTPDPVPIVDTGPVDSSLGPGPWGDYCYGVPQILEPTADATVGLTFDVSVQAPPCIRTMLVYMNGSGKPISPVIGPLDGAIYTLTVTVPHDEADAFVNANGWDNTNDAHASDHLYFHISGN